MFGTNKNRLTKLLATLLALCVAVAGTLIASGVTGRHIAQAQSLSTTINKYPVPTGKDPWGTAIDSAGNIWVALPGCDPDPTCDPTTAPGKLAVFDPTTSTWIHTHRLPTGYAQPLFLAFDKQGNLWFPLPMGNSIGMYNPTAKTFQQWTVPTPAAGPWDLAIDAQGNIWFTEHFVNQIGRFDPTTHTFTEVPTPANNSYPYGITIDASGNIWFTENNSSVALIAEYTIQSQLLEYKIRNSMDSNLTPHLITVDGNGNIWWSEGFVGMIGELQVSKAVPGTNDGVTEYAYTPLCGSCGTHTSGIGVDSNGLIWFDDSLQSLVGSFPESGTGTFKLHHIPPSGSHPHDGLIVDSMNRVWFDEEFSNALGELIYTP